MRFAELEPCFKKYPGLESALAHGSWLQTRVGHPTSCSCCKPVACSNVYLWCLTGKLFSWTLHLPLPPERFPPSVNVCSGLTSPLFRLLPSLLGKYSHCM